ncbi:MULTISPECIES: alanine:cation symporter family protein [Microbacterium]|uniref:alanine:cation symporter family protein n=1 Tax=Microbacterium TaxID=33882 RepID=UPI0004A7E811|nr:MULTISPECIES: alanine:cation symporter family protein [Microbacterium]
MVIVAMHIERLPGVSATIFLEAFGPNEVVGAALGYIILTGVMRGMFSNEAGLGSAPNAGASAAVTHPVERLRVISPYSWAGAGRVSPAPLTGAAAERPRGGATTTASSTVAPHPGPGHPPPGCGAPRTR